MIRYDPNISDFDTLGVIRYDWKIYDFVVLLNNAQRLGYGFRCGIVREDYSDITKPSLQGRNFQRKIPPQ